MSRGIKAEEKIKIVRACIRGDISVSAAATQLGVDYHAVNDWIRLYEMEGVEALLPRKGNRQYTPALKEAAVKDSLSGRDSV